MGTFLEGVGCRDYNDISSPLKKQLKVVLLLLHGKHQYNKIL